MVGSVLQHFHPASQSCKLTDSLLNECKAMFWFAHMLLSPKCFEAQFLYCNANELVFKWVTASSHLGDPGGRDL
jgi:hypothetical protein